MEIHAPTNPSDHSVPVSAYTNLIKASWILIDIIDHHPQLTLVTADTRLEVLLLAAVSFMLKIGIRYDCDLQVARSSNKNLEESTS